MKQLQLDLDGHHRFTSLWEKNSEMVRKFIFSISAEPEWLYQQVQLKAWRGFKKFNNKCKFSTWLCTIAKNTNINNSKLVYKKEEIQASDYIENLDYKAKELCGIDKMVSDEIMEEIQLAISKLPEPHKSVFIEYELNGKSHKEISQETGIPEGTIRTRLFYAKQELQKELAHLR